MARTVQVYDFAVVRAEVPENWIGLAAPAVVLATPAFDDVQLAQYPVMGELLATAPENDTVAGPVRAVVDPDRVMTTVGGAGVPTMTVGDATDAGPEPITFLARTVQV